MKIILIYPKKNNTFIFILICILNINNVLSQNFGGHNPTIQWKQIENSNNKIIFSDSFTKQATKISNIITYLQKQENQRPFGKYPQKIDIVVQNQQAFFNGYVSVTPFRSEFFLTNPTDIFHIGAEKTETLLSLHEYRHVQQFNLLHKKTLNILKYFLGDFSRGYGLFLAHNWFLEGDAVYNETKYSSFGRGNLPQFMQAFKALDIANKNYSFTQINNGSYIHNIPNHYNFGYLLVNYGIEKYGSDFWDKVGNSITKYEIRRAIKKTTNIKFKKFQQNAFLYYKNIWYQKDTFNYQTKIEKKSVNNYLFPNKMDDSNFIILKTSYDKLASFVKINAHNFLEEKLVTRKFSFDNNYGYNQQKIIYTTYSFHPRFLNIQYNNINIYDIKTKSNNVITQNKKYYMPDIAHKANWVLAVEESGEHISKLCLLNMEGEIIQEIVMDETRFYYPKFSINDSACIVAVAHKNKMALIKIHLFNNEQKIILPYTKRIVGYPVINGDTILFTTTYKGNDELWCYIENKDKMYRMVNYPTGTYQGFFQNKTIISSVFTADGFRLIQTNPLWQAVIIEDELKPLYTSKLDNFNQDNFNSINFDTPVYTKHTYTPSHPFKPLGWIPLYIPPFFTFSIYHKNVLNNFSSITQYIYNENDRSHNVNIQGIFGKYLVQPIIALGFTTNNVVYSLDRYALYYNEFNKIVGLNLPLNFIKNYNQVSFRFTSFINSTERIWQDLATKYLKDYSYTYINNQLYVSNQIQKTYQQLYPAFAQSISLQYRKSLDSFNTAYFNATLNLFFPGLFKNHSFNLVYSTQFSNHNRRLNLSNNVNFARGYNYINLDEVKTIQANYRFPIIYPEIGINYVFYVKRIQGNIFYDNTNVYNLNSKNNITLNTVGAEVLFEINIYNQVPLTLGVRYNYLLDSKENKNIWEISLPIPFY